MKKAEETEGSRALFSDSDDLTKRFAKGGARNRVLDIHPKYGRPKSKDVSC